MMADLIAVLGSVAASYVLRFFYLDYAFMPVPENAPFAAYAKAVFVVVPVYFVFLKAYGLYNPHRRVRRIEEIFIVFKAASFSILVLMACTFFYRGFTYSRVYLVILWVLSSVLLSMARYLVIQLEYKRRIKDKNKIKVLLVGGNRNSRQIIQWANLNPHYGHQIIGVLVRDADLVGKHLEDISILGVSDQALNFISHLKPDQVILLDPNFPHAQIADLVAHCEDLFIDFKLAPDLYGIMSHNVNIEYMSSVPLIGFRDLPLDDVWNRFVKRLCDIVMSSACLLFAAPLCVLIVIAIKLESPGPILFRQKRMGRNQVIFNLLKFRTMRPDAEKEAGPVWAKANDSRRTRIGTLLRRWNLDELPQLFNVLRGDMSFVGPRPERPHFIEQFRDEVPRYMARHKIKSGLTGWAQVNGLRGNTSIQERLKYDLYYMENWSLLFDLEIIFMTVFAFKNAY